MRIFLLQLCDFFVILWFNLFWTFILERKICSRIIFWAIGVSKKLQIFKNIEKTPYRRVAQKRTILHQAPQVTLFFDSPCIYINIYAVHYTYIIICLFVCISYHSSSTTDRFASNFYWKPRECSKLGLKILNWVIWLV